MKGYVEMIEKENKKEIIILIVMLIIYIILVISERTPRNVPDDSGNSDINIVCIKDKCYIKEL